MLSRHGDKPVICQMKKLLLMAVGALMAASASAQVMTSQTYMKSKSPTLWYARLGLSFNNVAGAGDVAEAGMDGEGSSSLGCRAGMSIDFGFQRPISNFGLYWGMELGIGSRGGSVKYEYDEEDGEVYTENGHISTWNVKYSPFTFGYKYSVTDDIKLDAHLGAYVSYDFSGKSVWSWSGEDEDEELSISDLKDSEWNFQPLDAGIQFGIGVWWKRFNLDFTYQRGFIPAAEKSVRYSDSYGHYSDSENYNLYSSNFMVRLGVAF